MIAFAAFAILWTVLYGAGLIALLLDYRSALRQATPRKVRPLTVLDEIRIEA